ncbi:MAG: hypothetical protein M1831_001505 [Alyxoria varia]|nr:MAG: hypothetical protein M1831_001505 [Alyxoria varia]
MAVLPLWGFWVVLLTLTSLVSAQNPDTSVVHDEFCNQLHNTVYTHPDGAQYNLFCGQDWNGTDIDSLAYGGGVYPTPTMTECITYCEVDFRSECEWVNYQPSWGGYTPVCWPRRGLGNINGYIEDREAAFRIAAPPPPAVEPASISSLASASRASVLSVRLASESSASAARASSLSVRSIRSDVYSRSRESARSLRSSVAVANTVDYRYDGCRIFNTPTAPLDIFVGTYRRLTLQYCANKCIRHPYFGVVHGNECWCGNSIIQGSYPAPEEWCWDENAVPCGGNQYIACGGDSGMAIYGAIWSINTCTTIPPSPAPGCQTLTATRNGYTAPTPTPSPAEEIPPANMRNAALPARTTSAMVEPDPEPAEQDEHATEAPTAEITPVPGSKEAEKQARKREVIRAET